jgi:hypothetical protein
LFDLGYNKNKKLRLIILALKEKKPRHRRILLAECELFKGYLYYRERLYVPADEELHAELLRLYHASPVAGHMGRTRTYEVLSRKYYWPGMLSYVERWVRNCHTCKRTIALREARQGVLKFLPISQKAWQNISMDFITHLPNSYGYDAILIIIDRLIKMKHFIYCKKTCNSEKVTRLYIKYIWKLHNLSKTIVFDRGFQFVSEFWKHLIKRLGIIVLLSIAYYFKTDGQTEIANFFLEQYLRGYVSYLQNN